MNIDEERLYDPTTDDDEIVTTTRVLDATRIATSTPETATATDSSDTTPISTTPPRSPAPPKEQRKRWFILEPAVFLIFLGKYLSDSVYQNQILYQTCIAILEYNQTDCQQLLGTSIETPEARAIETKVQPYVTKIIMTRSLIESIIPALVSLFIGPWSDKFGRRPIILTTFSGYFASYAILTSITFISTKFPISPWLFLLSSVPSILSGGSCALITGIYCYISDVAKERARALRMVLNEASLCAGIMLGNVASGYLYAATNVLTVFIVSCILMVIALLYAVIFVVESLPADQIHGGSKIREFFRIDLVKDLVRTCFRRRPSYDRAIIWLTMSALTIAIFTMEGDSNVTYLFVRKKFEWTVKDYSLYNASRIIVQIIGSVFGMFLLRKILKFSIVTMTMISLACCVLESTVRATAMYWWELYVGLVLGIMRGVMGPMARAILSHVAPANEVGKIYALTTSLESLSPLGAAPLYTLVYTATLETNPGVYNFISAGLYLLCFTLITAISGIHRSIGQTASYQAIGS